MPAVKPQPWSLPGWDVAERSFTYWHQLLAPPFPPPLFLADVLAGHRHDKRVVPMFMELPKRLVDLLGFPRLQARIAQVVGLRPGVSPHSLHRPDNEKLARAGAGGLSCVKGEA